MKYIPFYSSLSALYISCMGYNYDWLENVYLSSGDTLFPFLCAVNAYTTLRRVSAICPSFSGYPLDSDDYRVIDSNNITVTLNITSFNASGLIDIIFANKAGYTKLSDKNYLIQTYIDALLLENGGILLQENGGKLLL